MEELKKEELKELRTKISKSRAELDEEYYSFGKKIYEVFDKENQRITILIDQIIDCRIKMYELNQFLLCDDCGNENNLNNKFCHNCGVTLLIH